MGVSGILLRSIAWAIIVGIGWVEAHQPGNSSPARRPPGLRGPRDPTQPEVSGHSLTPGAAHPSRVQEARVDPAPNQVWSWDITRLLGPKKWSYYYLYVIMDIYSRYVVGWMVADRENSALAGRLIQQSCLKHGSPGS